MILLAKADLIVDKEIEVKYHRGYDNQSSLCIS